MLNADMLAGSLCTNQASIVREHAASVAEVRGGLEDLGVPSGLAARAAEDDHVVGLRVYLLDNSGSTRASDQILVDTNTTGEKFTRPCTRWEEICAFAMDHAQWNLAVGTPCDFFMLNSAKRLRDSELLEGRDFVHLEKSVGKVESELQKLRDLLDANGPHGVTPIVERVGEIRERVEAHAPLLAETGQVIVLIIVTDGMPTSPSCGESTEADRHGMVRALQRLCAALPVRLVFRLCTQEEFAVDFYHSVESVDLPLNVVDSLAVEAGKIARHGNDWFAYTPVLHTMREAGAISELLATLRRRTLLPAEARELAELLSDSRKALTSLRPRSFIAEMQRLSDAAPQVFDAHCQDTVPRVNIPRLRMAMKVGFRGWLLPAILPCMVSRHDAWYNCAGEHWHR